MNIHQNMFGLLSALLLAGGLVQADDMRWPDEIEPAPLEGPLFRVFEKGKWGFIDKTGKLVIPAIYDTTTDFYEGKACVALDKNFYYILRDDGTRIRSTQLRSPFRDGRAFAATGPGYNVSVIDEKGNVIAGPFEDFEPYSDGWAMVKPRDEEWIYIDRMGKQVLSITNTIHNAPEQRSCNAGSSERPTYPHPYASGLSRIFLGHEKWAYLDKNAQVAIPARFERAYDFCEGLARVRENGKWGYIQPSGSYVVEPRYDDARDFHEGMAAVKTGDKWGYINSSGKQVIAPQFDEPQRFQEGMALIFKDGKTGFMDKTGKVVITPKFDGAREFRDGLAMIWQGTKHGYINPQGEIIYTYDTFFEP